jgi:hypothetical protein
MNKPQHHQIRRHTVALTAYPPTAGPRSQAKPNKRTNPQVLRRDHTLTLNQSLSLAVGLPGPLQIVNEAPPHRGATRGRAGKLGYWILVVATDFCVGMIAHGYFRLHGAYTVAPIRTDSHGIAPSSRSFVASDSPPTWMLSVDLTCLFVCFVKLFYRKSRMAYESSQRRPGEMANRASQKSYSQVSS